MNTQKQIALIVILLFVFVGGCTAYSVVDLPFRAQDQAQWQTGQSVERGALLFANNCRTCHGIKGQGGVGLPLNIDKFKDQDPLALKNNRALLQHTLYCGRAGTRMPAWLNTNGGSLNETQISHLVDLITQPIDPNLKDDEGNPTSKGWLQAVEFGENLNRETVLVVGGDTLATIAKDHGVGLAQLQQLNPGLALDEKIPTGTKIRLGENGTYSVVKDNETLRKINDNAFVGAALLASLNNIPHTVTERLGSYTMKIGDSPKSTTVGLLPGAELALPDGATYILRAGDTLQSIADQRGLTPGAIQALNNGTLKAADAKVTTIANDTVLLTERRLDLGPNPTVIVREGQTLATIATQHGIKPADIASLNNLANETAPLASGQQLKLPDGTRYTVQTGDTINSVANDHKMSADQLISLNKLDPNQPLTPEIVIKLPKVDRYKVKGQSLADIAKTLSNVTAESLAAAQKPAVQPDHIYPVGATLVMPADAWGSAPPDAINQGTACVQYAVPDSVYQQISGASTPKPTPTVPPVASRDVTIRANANDWTVTADGQSQPPNEGAVRVAPGTTVRFTNAVGLHTITVNGETRVPQFTQGQEQSITFSSPGTYKITCDFHPAMVAYVFVENQ